MNVSVEIKLTTGPVFNLTPNSFECLKESVDTVSEGCGFPYQQMQAELSAKGMFIYENEHGTRFTVTKKTI